MKVGYIYEHYSASYLRSDTVLETADSFAVIDRSVISDEATSKFCHWQPTRSCAVTRCDIEYIGKFFKDNTISLVLVHYPKIGFLTTLHILVIDILVSFCANSSECQILAAT